MAEINLILNFIIIFLLVTAIIYGFILNKRIKLIRDSGRELSHLFRSFDDTILKAQNSIEDLKKVSNEVAQGLQVKIDKAVLLVDEIDFLAEKANQASKKLNFAISEFKNIDSKIPQVKQNNTTQTVPLVTQEMINKNSQIHEAEIKPSRHKALEQLLQEVSNARDIIQNNVIDKINKPIATPVKNIKNDSEASEIRKKQFSIASALKAMGYGDS